MVNKNVNRPGYKQTKLGWIPEDWEVVELEEIGEFKNGINKDKKEFGHGYPFVNLMDIFDKVKVYNKKFNLVNSTKKEHKEFSLKKGDVLFVRSSVKPEGVGLTSLIAEDLLNTVYSGFLIRFREESNKLNFEYKEHCFFEKNFRKDLLKKSTISVNTNINQNILKKLSIYIPTLPEQKKISEILSSWDNAIDLTEKLITLKKQCREGLLQKLLTGKKRFSKFVNNTRYTKTKIGILSVDWKIKKVEEVFVRVQDSFIPEPDKLYQEIGIRSHGKGLFYKEKVTGKSLGNKRVFNIIPNCFVVNIVFAWEHAIGKTTEREIGMIASHRFPMYKPKENMLDLDFILSFFSTKRGKLLLNLASPGGAGRNKTLGQKEFANTLIPVPSLDEQKLIAKVLTTCDNEINLLKRKFEKLKEQKKGLMQKLLTGEVRVKR